MNLSPTVHEATIARHIVKDADDPTLQSLHDAVKQTRELATKAAATTDIVLKNEMRTMAARHKDARAASFELLKRATQSIDAAVQSAQAEITAIKSKLKGPPPSRDRAIESRQAELRERLAMLPEDRRKAIIEDAIKTDDQLLLGAVLHGYAWECGMSDPEISIVRHNWASKHHAADLDRLERLSKAVDDANRAGSVALAFVDGLTNADLVAKAEHMEKQATAALAAVK
jgi:hypothetical protein